jgi:hypothetical protein
MDIVVWLRSLRLRKYEAAFRENEIDETILPNPPTPKACRGSWCCMGILADLKPEAAYFFADDNGNRSGSIVFDLKDSSQKAGQEYGK